MKIEKGGKRLVSSGFIIRGKGKRILLGKADGHKEPYCWTVFKGQIEEGEDLINTAIRELKEESGIDINSDMRLNKNISSNYVYSYNLHHKDVYLFILEDVEGALDSYPFSCSSIWGDTGNPEISNYQWFTVDEMDNYIFPSQRGLVEFLKNKYNK